MVVLKDEPEPVDVWAADAFQQLAWLRRRMQLTFNVELVELELETLAVELSSGEEDTVVGDGWTMVLVGVVWTEVLAGVVSSGVLVGVVSATVVVGVV